MGLAILMGIFSKAVRKAIVPIATEVPAKIG